MAVMKDNGPRKIVLQLVTRAVLLTEDLMRTYEFPHEYHKYHRQRLSDEERMMLSKRLPHLVHAKEKLESNPALHDLPVTDICECDTVLRLFAKEGIKTVFDVWSKKPEEIVSLLERSKPMGGKYELHLYFFLNEA